MVYIPSSQGIIQDTLSQQVDFTPQPSDGCKVLFKINFKKKECMIYINGKEVLNYVVIKNFGHRLLQTKK